MRLRKRLDRVAKRMGAGQPQPLTVVLVESPTGRPLGQIERTNSAGLPVLEIAFDRARGPVELPRAPFKLVCGVDPVDLV